ncbi:MAG: YggS family pyridoxal phosphate-dependent enzyme [Candidatus Sumerlaeota bacterium]|nr:YggS family pyridoxal phosphate-dependent enzyme [Candidatus Sumerlaeota bacterium]
MTIAQNLENIHRWMEEAAGRAGRDPRDAQLLAVVKNRSLEEIRQVYEAGECLAGFNRIQEAQEKIPAAPAGIQWHLIGHIQTNKARFVPGLFRMAHSVDSFHAAWWLNKAQINMGTGRFDILLEVNVSGEESKYGLKPEEVEIALRDIAKMEALRVRGLMTMAPLVENPEDTRPIFRALRLLRDRLRDLGLENAPMDHLSMGMTNDFEIAIEEGATIVRVGTAIFE